MEVNFNAHDMQYKRDLCLTFVQKYRHIITSEKILSASNFFCFVAPFLRWEYHHHAIKKEVVNVTTYVSKEIKDLMPELNDDDVFCVGVTFHFARKKVDATILLKKIQDSVSECSCDHLDAEICSILSIDDQAKSAARSDDEIGLIKKCMYDQYINQEVD